MISGWTEDILAGIQALNQVLTAGIAITALSLFLYALSFNLRDRVARSFAVILLCVLVTFSTDALQHRTMPLPWIEGLQRLQWIGIVFLPAAYVHLSDALLVTAGRPSRGRRRLAVRGMYVLAVFFAFLLATGRLVGPLAASGAPAPHLAPTAWTSIFNGFYVVSMAWAGVNFVRAYRRMLTRSGRRRMAYLMAGGTAPAIGSYPYLLFGSGIAAAHPFLFWGATTAINLIVGALVVVMAYSVAFFGVSWPDRVVKSRLFKWIVRGPVTASAALWAMTALRRTSELLDLPSMAIAAAGVAATILVLEHAITFAAPVWERWLFYGRDRADLQLLQNVEERLLTLGDLQQFLEGLLAAVRDHLQAPSAFIAALDGDLLLPILLAGNRTMLDQQALPGALEQLNGSEREEFRWGDFWVLPLHERRNPGMDRDEPVGLLGLLGVARPADRGLEREQREALWLLADRAALALEDRRLQQRVFRSLQDLEPQVEMIQRLRAATRYDPAASLPGAALPPDADLATWVKDALTHFWGGPKLTTSPLMSLRIVRDLTDEADGNAANGLRKLLRRAVDRVRPAGERRFTTEWILYNILEMKFLEGRKVRDVAARLAMSEADLYRKQRVAVEAVARAVMEMETELQPVGKEA
jgi:hypothetical protein